jgi:hypothetical protein
MSDAELLRISVVKTLQLIAAEMHCNNTACVHLAFRHSGFSLGQRRIYYHSVLDV